MKNSKLLSLLTAGALVVSSFSGLAMNGSVSRAAIADAGTANTPGYYGWTGKDAHINSQDAGTPVAAPTAGTDFTYAVNGGSKDLTGTLTIIIPASDTNNDGALNGRYYNNISDMPKYGTDFTVTGIAYGANLTGAVGATNGITITPKESQFADPDGNAGSGDEIEKLIYNYTINPGTLDTTNNAAGNTVTLTFAFQNQPRSLAAAVPPAAAVDTPVAAWVPANTFTLQFAVTNTPPTITGTAANGIVFTDEIVNGNAVVTGAAKRTDAMTWSVTGVNDYTTVMATRLIGYGAALGSDKVYCYAAAEDAKITTDLTTRAADRWGVITTSSNPNVVVPQAVNGESAISLVAYGIGTAVITVELSNNAGIIKRGQITVTTVPGDAYLRLYESNYYNDVQSLTFSGDGATHTLNADMRSASYYGSETKTNWLVVNSQGGKLTNATGNDSDKTAKHFMSYETTDTSITLTAVGNGTTYLYAWTNLNGQFDKYLATCTITGDATAKTVETLERMLADQTVAGNTAWRTVRRIPLYSNSVTEAVGTSANGELKLRADGNSVSVTTWVNQQGVGASTNAASATNAKIEVSEDSSAKVISVTQNADGSFVVKPVAEGTATITVKASYYVNGKLKTPETTIAVDVNSGSAEPEKYQPGDVVKENGVTGIVNEDGETVTVTDVTVVDKAITIPETVDELKVTAVAPQAFKKSGAKIVYVYGAVEELGKGAFKASKVKKVYFFQPAALQTVGKNAFKKTDAKVVGVGAAFSDDAAKQLKKAGAKSVKNNGTAK